VLVGLIALLAWPLSEATGIGVGAAAGLVLGLLLSRR
jgi:hypothetical protein